MDTSSIGWRVASIALLQVHGLAFALDGMLAWLHGVRRVAVSVENVGFAEMLSHDG
jgi:hypothetical protein